MPVDPALSALAKPIEGTGPWPRPACPKCQTGYIAFAKPIEDESHESAFLHDHEYFDPEWVTGAFTIRGECENPECKQSINGVGDYSVGVSNTFDINDLEYIGVPYTGFYAMKHLHPPLLIMSTPSSAPTEVREGIIRASHVLFADPGLAATALRATVERFLTSEGISAVSDGGKFRSAHERIQEWANAEAERPSVADLFFAVKWLGNAGTHEDSDLTTIEVLDGARVLDEAFHRLFTGPDIEAYARSINEAKGPSRDL